MSLQKYWTDNYGKILPSNKIRVVENGVTTYRMAQHDIHRVVNGTRMWSSNDFADEYNTSGGLIGEILSELQSIDTKTIDTSDVTVASSVLPTGPATSTNQSTIIGHVDGIETVLGNIDADTGAIKTAVELIDDAISGNEMQVDIVGELPSGTQTIGYVKQESQKYTTHTLFDNQSTEQTSTGVDCRGYGSITIICNNTSDQAIDVQAQGSHDNTNWFDIAGADTIISAGTNNYILVLGYFPYIRVHAIPASDILSGSYSIFLDKQVI